MSARAEEPSEKPEPPAPSKARTTPPRAQTRYAVSVQRWHAKGDAQKPVLDEQGRPKLTLESVNTREVLSVPPLGDDGRFSPEDRARIDQLLRDPRTNQVTSMDERLLALVYRLQRHFDAPAIRVVSAYREPRGKKPSRHGQGKAVDLIVPGTPDSAVAAFAHGFGSCGVGLYPKSGFVHLDVREQNHFWVDRSGPGQHARGRKPGKKLPKQAKRAAAPRARAAAPKS